MRSIKRRRRRRQQQRQRRAPPLCPRRAHCELACARPPARRKWRCRCWRKLAPRAATMGASRSLLAIWPARPTIGAAASSKSSGPPEGGGGGGEGRASSRAANCKSIIRPTALFALSVWRTAQATWPAAPLCFRFGRPQKMDGESICDLCSRWPASRPLGQPLPRRRQ